MLNVKLLTDSLADNPDRVRLCLEALNIHPIRYDSAQHSFRFPRKAGHNPTSVSLNVKTLTYNCFSSPDRGNLYSLVMKLKNCSFPQALSFVCKSAGLQESSFSKKTRLPFGGFYKGLVASQSEPEQSLQTYPESILAQYDTANSLQFIQDGIDALTQERFHIGFDPVTNRITIPQYSFDGKLVGIMGRSNRANCPHEERWYPILKTSRSLTLYGYHFNYFHIQQKRTVVIGESEKFVMQCASFGCNVALATCGCYLSDTQARYLKMLRPSLVIFAYDEGLSQDHLIQQASKLVTANPLLSCRVGYVWDPQHDFIPQNSKQNAADLGKQTFQSIIQSKIQYLN